MTGMSQRVSILLLFHSKDDQITQDAWMSHQGEVDCGCKIDAASGPLRVMFNNHHQAAHKMYSIDWISEVIIQKEESRTAAQHNSLCKLSHTVMDKPSKEEVGVVGYIVVLFEVSTTTLFQQAPHFTLHSRIGNVRYRDAGLPYSAHGGVSGHVRLLCPRILRERSCKHVETCS